jgi:hypothetical protein
LDLPAAGAIPEHATASPTCQVCAWGIAIIERAIRTEASTGLLLLTARRVGNADPADRHF